MTVTRLRLEAVIKKAMPCLFLIALILTSCADNEVKSAKKQIDEADQLKEILVPILNGVWVRKDYLAKIAETKSPLKSADKLLGLSTIVIQAKLGADSIEAGASLGNHEGSDFTIYFEKGVKNTSLKTNIQDYKIRSNFYELGYEKKDQEVCLVLYHYDSANKLLDKKTYTKVADRQKDSDLAEGLQYSVNGKLFSGSYTMLDSLNTETKIALTTDGKITGHPSFKTYYVATDFLGETENSLDQIGFDIYEQKSTWLAFKIGIDTIYLYNTLGSDGKVLQPGKIKYKLVKKKK